MIVSEKIKRESLARLIATTLEHWVFQEKFKPGTRLKESHIAKQLGTSQTPVREALRILEERGIVTHVPDVGATVVSLSEKDVDEMLALRSLLEPVALEGARHHATQKEKEDLKNLLAKLSLAAEENDLLNYHMFHMEFHRSIWQLSHNRHIAVLLDRVCAPLWAFYRQRVRNNPERHLSGARTHQPLLEFIENRTSQAITAQKLLEDHLNDVAGFTPKSVLAS